MKCFDPMCDEEAVESGVYGSVSIRTCKSGHRTGKYVEASHEESNDRGNDSGVWNAPRRT